MGLFSFIKTAGSSLLRHAGIEAKDAVAKNPAPDVPTDEQIRAERNNQIVQEVNNMGLPIKDVSVEVEGDKLTVWGLADTNSVKEKVVLTLGNVQGIATVDDRISVSNPDAEPEAELYTVKRGDSLSKIANRFYGDEMRYREIFTANKPMLKDLNLIYPGQVLRIPKG
jgi:nucleoid-associated protein YgaU